MGLSALRLRPISMTFVVAIASSPTTNLRCVASDALKLRPICAVSIAAVVSIVPVSDDLSIAHHELQAGFHTTAVRSMVSGLGVARVRPDGDDLSTGVICDDVSLSGS